jgi:hypothetical protein
VLSRLWHALAGLAEPVEALAVLATGVAAVTDWAYLTETGLVYPLALGVAVWLAVLVARRVRRWRRDNAN